MSIVCCVALALSLPGKFYPSVSYTSDYRYNGVSYSGREPTPQASLHWIGARGWYAGVWTSGVDFDDPGNTSVEGDLYAGRSFDFGQSNNRLHIHRGWSLGPRASGGAKMITSRHFQSATDKPPAKQIARPRQPREHGPLGAAQSPSRFLAAHALQIAQQHRLTIFLRQAVHFLIENRPQLPPERICRLLLGRVLSREVLHNLLNAWDRTHGGPRLRFAHIRPLRCEAR